MDTLNDVQIDRAVGSVLASAAGDALGSAYEFGPAHGIDWKPEFGVGYFGHGVGEWTDDTSMAIPILEWVAAHGEFPKRHILERWIAWSKDSKDVGILTRTVLQRLKTSYTDLEGHASKEAKAVHDFNGKTAGNGSLLRIGPYAVRDIRKPLRLDDLSELTRWTHYDEDNVIACRFWVEAIRGAILTGEVDLDKLIAVCELEDNERWLGFIAEASASEAKAITFASSNGWVVAALQASLAAVLNTESLEEALYDAIRGGNDTDTVAAITGSLAGALYGANAIPKEWKDTIYGWPGVTAKELEVFALKAVQNF